VHCDEGVDGVVGEKTLCLGRKVVDLKVVVNGGGMDDDFCAESALLLSEK